MTQPAIRISQFMRRLKRTETIFSIGILFLVIGSVSFIANQLNQPVITQTITGQKVSLPAGWEMYTNKTYGFSIGHHSVFKPKESTYTLPSNAQASQRGVFSVSFQAKVAANQTPEAAPIDINVSHQTLDQAVALAKSNIASYSNNNFKLTITKEQKLTVSGYQAVRIDVHKVDESKGLKQPDTDFTNFYIDANHLTYNIATQLTKAKPFDDADAQTMFTSFVIASKK